MAEPRRVVLAHGGAGSQNEYQDGTEAACRQALDLLRSGAPVLRAACGAVVTLENDGRFNAGIGSRRRSDGSVQMDAACMDSQGHFGAVAVVEGYKNPVLIAQAVTILPFHLLAGRGAAAFAHESDMDPFDPGLGTPGARASDTVGCVAFDGEHFAAALSTGGTGGTMPGRVGDVPLVGCGLYAGPYGAVAATGNGEAIMLHLTAFRAYQMLEEGMGPHFVLEEVLGWFAEDEDIGLLLVSRKDHAAGSNRSMAWSVLETGSGD